MSADDDLPAIERDDELLGLLGVGGRADDDPAALLLADLAAALDDLAADDDGASGSADPSDEGPDRGRGRHRVAWGVTTAGAVIAIAAGGGLSAAAADRLPAPVQDVVARLAPGLVHEPAAQAAPEASAAPAPDASTPEPSAVPEVPAPLKPPVRQSIERAAWLRQLAPIASDRVGSHTSADGRAADPAPSSSPHRPEGVRPDSPQAPYSQQQTTDERRSTATRAPAATPAPRPTSPAPAVSTPAPQPSRTSPQPTAPAEQQPTENPTPESRTHQDYHRR